MGKKLQFRKGIYGLYKKQKRQDWDHKAYHDTPSAISQYGSTVYIGIAMGGPALYCHILVFTFSFNLNLSSKDIEVENM